MNINHSLLPLLLLLAPSPIPSRAAEPWADPGLNFAPTNSLILWLDASRQNTARQSLGLPALGPNDFADRWLDASGRGHHVAQRVQAAQPRFMPTGERDLALMRFDGDNDHFGSEHFRESFGEFTVFILTAPRSNAGIFRGFLAVNQAGQRDYTSGFNVDLGPDATDSFSSLNPEGKGFGGARNLRNNSTPFKTPVVIELSTDPAVRRIQVRVDGVAEGSRSFEPAPIRADEITVGARCFSNTSDPNHIQGFLDGDIAEILLFNTALAPEESARVRDYLVQKRARLARALADGRLAPLQAVANPPPVQVLVPGFAVRALPVKIRNINDLEYHPDGRLAALAYDGRIHFLSDTDGDGLEDTVRAWWDRETLRGPIAMAIRPEGIYVSSHKKISRLRDTDNDGAADVEDIVATDWDAGDVPTGGGVDCVGMTFDNEGRLWFSLGCYDFTNPYRLKDGKARYGLGLERGTVLRMAPDFASREIVSTGVRFLVSLKFNRHGDLFATEQEGATWNPNGNPFDELLHIQPGRHYGFPARHPDHLPNVIDEPSVFDYGPQHQCTCGLHFNGSGQPGDPAPRFGPAWWGDDAFVAGFSRGKLWRTKLVKTPAGYVAQNNLIACLDRMIVDACVAPDSGLVVATHSGQPDWGTGPTGEGRLYKIMHTDTHAPQPVLAYASGPAETTVAFDRPLRPSDWAALSGKVTVEYGRHVQAADRFESFRPGYQVVKDQMAAPRFSLSVHAAQLSPDFTRILLVTEPRREAYHYAVTLPGLGRPDGASRATGELPQSPETDLVHGLNGVEASWQSTAAGSTPMAAWLPHPDTEVARTLTQPIDHHRQFWSAARQPGTLRLRGQLDLRDMLRPVVQPGSKIDYTWPSESVTLTFRGSAPVELRSPHGRIESARPSGGPAATTWTLQPSAESWNAFELAMATGPDTRLEVTWHTAEDPRPRALPLHRLLLPWAVPPGSESSPDSTPGTSAPELAGGSWGRGKHVYFSEDAKCAQCHVFRGHGLAIGPDLSNLAHRDAASVLRDIHEPGAAINPDYVNYELTLRDGEAVIGVAHADGEDRFNVGIGPGLFQSVPRGQIARMRPLGTSLMPPGLDLVLGPDRMKDLLTFLTQPPPVMPQYANHPPPAARSRDELQAVFGNLPEPPPNPRPLHVILVAGPKDHGKGEHDYPAWQNIWAELLRAETGITVDTAWEWPDAAQWEKADAVVVFQRGRWDDRRARDMDAFMARGGGMMFLHWAVEAGDAAPDFAKRIGLASNSARTKYRHGELDLEFNAAVAHPITRGFRTLHVHDESYWDLVGDPDRIRVLATGVEEGRARPLLWTVEHGKGRVFVSILGHYSWTFDDPLVRLLMMRALAWSAHEPVDRFSSGILESAFP